MLNFAEQCKQFLQIKSVTTQGNEEIANTALSLMREAGLQTQLQQVMHSLEDVSKRQFNVIGILGDSLVDRKTKKGFLLCSHLDTISPGFAEHWTETQANPWLSKTENGKIYGLGAVDCKLDFLCKLHALKKFREKKLKMPVYLVGTAAREIGMLGAKYLAKSLTLNPKYVVVGEPSDLKIIDRHKSLSLLKVFIEYPLMDRDARGFNRKIVLSSFGRSEESAHPHQGIHAIEQLFDFLSMAEESGFEMRYSHFEGGDLFIHVPDHAKVEFFVTSHQLEDFKKFYREVVKVFKRESSFKVEIGGSGEAGRRFLPESLFGCLVSVRQVFKELSLELGKHKNSSYEPAYSTTHWVSLKQNNEGLALYFDMRLLPEISTDDVLKQCAQKISMLSAQFQSLNLRVKCDRTHPPLAMNVGNEFLEICQKAMDLAQLTGGFLKKSTSTEASVFFDAGFEAVAFGPGASYGSSHGANEQGLLAHFEKAIVFYEKLIEKICL